jgi:hypothetical protein
VLAEGAVTIGHVALAVAARVHVVPFQAVGCRLVDRPVDRVRDGPLPDHPVHSASWTGPTSSDASRHLSFAFERNPEVGAPKIQSSASCLLCMHGIMQTSVSVPLDFASTADRHDPVPSAA